jgi:signal transduction histidine kinase
MDAALSTLIHELQTPVTIIKGFASALLTAADRMDRRAILTAAGAVGRGAETLQSLIHSLADARAIDAGTFHLDIENVDLVELVHEVAGDLEMITAPHPVEVTGTGPVRIDADAVRIRQVLTNLLSNAAKFSSSDRPIRMSIESDGDVAKVAVEDEGPGIPRDRIKLLFRKFSRLGTHVPGTGLGLYVSRGIAAAHGGDIRVTSIEGRGSRFVLELPVSGKPQM